MKEPDKELEMAPEVDLRTRQAQVLPLLTGSESILEVGCGEGRTLRLLSRSGCRSVGIDISEAALQAAARYGVGFERAQANALHLPFTTARFDAVMALEVLEHIPDWQTALDELFRVSRKRVIVTVPFREWLKSTNCSHCGGKVALYGHVHRFTCDTFNAWRTKGQMTIGKIGAPMEWLAYFRKGITWFRTAEQDRRDPPSQVYCPYCGTALPFALRWERLVDRLWRLAVRKPEWLLVAWDTSRP